MQLIEVHFKDGSKIHWYEHYTEQDAFGVFDCVLRMKLPIFQSTCLRSGKRLGFRTKDVLAIFAQVVPGEE